MTIASLDPYQRGASSLHRLDARIKLALTIGYILTAALLSDGAWAAQILHLSLILAAAALAEVRYSVLLRRSLLVLPFFLAALPVLVSLHGAPLAQIALAGRTLTISQPGLVRFLSIALKSWTSVLAAVLFTATTSFPQILVGLRALKAPRLLVAVIGLMWRYLFVMVDTASRLLHARSARSGVAAEPGIHSGGSFSWRARVTGGMAGSLLLRAVERSERIYAAMLARGYDGEARSLPLEPFKFSNWVILVAGLLLFVLIGLFGRLFPG